MRPRYALIWRRDGSPGIRWHIRCLDAGGFYGEVRYHPPDPSAGGRAVGVQKRLLAAAGERVAAILAEFSTVEPIEPGPCFALLGRYTESLAQGEVVFNYELGAETSCPRARLFQELHSILEPYLRDAYTEIEPGAARD